MAKTDAAGAPAQGLQLSSSAAERLQRLAQRFQRHFRPRRMREFAERFELTERDRILDVGGYARDWQQLGCALQVRIVNLEREEQRWGTLHKVYGDGRDLAEYADASFDVAYSNSVIEHVGDWGDQQRFAREIRRVARRYHVQTPNPDFPIDPHLLAPFIHWLPLRAQLPLARYCSPWGWIVRPSQAQTRAYLEGIRLVTEQELRELFPDAEIVHERFLGMVKSFLAIRR